MSTARARLDLELHVALDTVRREQASRLRALSQGSGFERVVLFRDEGVEVIGVRWEEGAARSLHGHGPVTGLVRVLEGVVVEDRFVPGPSGFVHETEALRPEGVTFARPGAYHRLRGLGSAVTIHAYDPPILDISTDAPLALEVALYTADLRRGLSPSPDAAEKIARASVKADELRLASGLRRPELDAHFSADILGNKDFLKKAA